MPQIFKPFLIQYLPQSINCIWHQLNQVGVREKLLTSTDPNIRKTRIALATCNFHNLKLNDLQIGKEIEVIGILSILHQATVPKLEAVSVLGAFRAVKAC
jgi:hypothetical protein